MFKVAVVIDLPYIVTRLCFFTEEKYRAFLILTHIKRNKYKSISSPVTYIRIHSSYIEKEQ